jgi:4-methyl-5(b-hydroxyethyl)-thiazole monophosphate biosynthesis
MDEAAAREWDMVVLPGGLPGATNLNADARVHDLLKRTAQAGRHVAAICAAPQVLASAGLLDDRRATAYPGTLDPYKERVEVTAQAVVKDGKIITSTGPGTAMDFALELIEALAGREKRTAVETPLMRPA